MQRGHSTHARGTNTLDQGVSSTLSALGTKAEENPEHRVRSLARLLNRQMLGEAFRKLKRRAAPGIDGVTHSFAVAWERSQIPTPKVIEKPWPR
jgi:hypothetical protein